MSCPYPFNRTIVVKFDSTELITLYELLIDATNKPRNQDFMMLDYFQALIDNLVDAHPDLHTSHADDCDGSLDE